MGTGCLDGPFVAQRQAALPDVPAPEITLSASSRTTFGAAPAMMLWSSSDKTTWPPPMSVMPVYNCSSVLRRPAARSRRG